MEIKLNVELKVPEGIISNLAEVDKTKLEEYLQECLVKYLSASKQETKEFKFDAISDMPVELEAELLPLEFIAKPTQPVNFDNISEMPGELLDEMEEESIERPTQPFKFDDIGAIANK